jgi:hypothetical protein
MTAEREANIEVWADPCYESKGSAWECIGECDSVEQGLEVVKADADAYNRFAIGETGGCELKWKGMYGEYDPYPPPWSDYQPWPEGDSKDVGYYRMWKLCGDGTLGRPPPPARQEGAGRFVWHQVVQVVGGEERSVWIGQRAQVSKVLIAEWGDARHRDSAPRSGNSKHVLFGKLLRSMLAEVLYLMPADICAPAPF